MERGKAEIVRKLPAVDRVLSHPALAEATRAYGRDLTTRWVRSEIDRLRAAVLSGEVDAGRAEDAARPEAIAARIAQIARELLEPRPRPVINATGVVVHTNLGRSVLSPEAARRVAEVATGYLDLEFDLDHGGRGKRLDHLDGPMGVLFPGRGFVAVNNNAAAIMLALRALARGKEVVISRGELVEIGGSFRVPDILETSGARLREVGTTNRTRARDYREAIGPDTGAILKVHTSNFEIVGFAESTDVAALAEVARDHGVPLIVDWGSGDLVDLAPHGITDERPVGALLEAGADLVTFSGDKLLGGPQAGMCVGRPDLVDRLRRDPLARVCRLDRVLVAALHATLVAYATGRAETDVPTLRMIAATADEVGARAEAIGERLRRVWPRDGAIRTEPGVSRTGGGSSPTGELATTLLVIEHPTLKSHVLERRLRAGSPAVVARVHDERLTIDLRTVSTAQEDPLVSRILDAAGIAEARR